MLCKNLCLGILAHVDAGKTTLSEALLYSCGAIKKLGRVDHRDAFLDTDRQERERGITIFAKQALFESGSAKWTLLDTPGHVDFTAEMERTLRVLDLSILIVDARTGVTDHSLALWELLEAYKLPRIIWINKMDLAAADYETIKQELKDKLGEACVDMGQDEQALYEEIATLDEELLNEFLETGAIKQESISQAIKSGKLVPCYYGSALKMEGIDKLISGLDLFASAMPEGSKQTDDQLGAIVYKISRDEKGGRLSHMKITHGTLKPKDVIDTGESEEKVNQIRLYSGGKFQAIDFAEPGMVVAIQGLDNTYAGQSLGVEPAGRISALELGRLCKISYPASTNEFKFIQQLGELEEELPEIQLYVDESEYEASAIGHEAGKLVLIRIMGDVQNEVLLNIISDRFNVDASIDTYVPPIIEIEEEEEEEEIDDRPDLNARWLSSGDFGGSDCSDEEELQKIFERTYGKQQQKIHKVAEVIEPAKAKKKELLGDYLLVDGYNIIFAWEDLRELAKVDTGAARDALIEMMCNYRSWTTADIVVVFDAYKIKGGQRRIERHGNIYVVYTEEAESADTYIEKLSYGMKKKYRVKVATSDYAEQVIALGNNAQPIWAADFRKDVDRVNEQIAEWLKTYKIKSELENRNRIVIKEGTTDGKND